MLSVPTIPPDLRHEETIIQAAYALACLEKTISSVFDSIDNRIKTNESKLQIINQRISRAQKGFQGLVGSKKSITIHTPSRFPGTQILREEIPSTFSKMKTQKCREMDTKKYAKFYEKYGRCDHPKGHNEKLVFFHVRSVPECYQRNEFNGHGTGLGAMPRDLEYVTSTLRFNTDDFVYDSARSSSQDSWKLAKLFKKEKYQRRDRGRDIQRDDIAPAPHSLSHREKKAKLGLRYTPRLRDLPDMDLPMDLPDLPGIADDIQFKAQEKQRIAPSLLIEDLPDLEELEKQQQLQLSEERNKENYFELTESAKLRIEPIPQTIVPPPPVTVNQVICPPPPPPPPPPQQLLKSKVLQSTDIRSDLMAAIRKAGGSEHARLRPAAPINAVAVNQITSDGSESTVENNKKPIAGGGFMGELHNKLLLRRKGISGTKNTEKEEKQPNNGSNNPLLTHLSLIIPQSQIGKKVEQDDNEDDWND